MDYSSITSSDEVEGGSKITGLVFPGSVVKYPTCQYRSCWSLSFVLLFATPWTVAHQTLPFMGFPRQEYWSGLPFPSPGDLPKPGIKPEFSCIGRQILHCLRGRHRGSLSVQGIQVRFLIWKESMCAEQLSLCTTTIEPILWRPGAATTEAHMPYSPCSTREATAISLRIATESCPHPPRLEKSSRSNKDLA